MKILTASISIFLLAFNSCSSTHKAAISPAPNIAEIATLYPPLKIPRLDSPVDLRTAVMTLPSDALSEMTFDGRRVYLGNPPGVFDKVNRRIELVCDNPYMGGDGESMVFLRLFEDEKGRTIAASHSARPFADASKPPSAQYTRVYRLENHKWHDITASAFSHGIPQDSYFRFDQKGSRVKFGAYVEKKRPDGKGMMFDFGETSGVIKWKNGTFRLCK